MNRSRLSRRLIDPWLPRFSIQHCSQRFRTSMSATALPLMQSRHRRSVPSKRGNYRTFLTLLALTAIALAVLGYHPFAEDAEIYLPGVEQVHHSELFPTGQDFFGAYSRLTIFPNLVALSARVTHLPLTAVLFFWQVASIFLLLLACWELSSLLFPSARARCGGVCLIAVLLSIPVAGTALYILDQYLNPRNLAAFSGVFAVARTLETKYVRAGLWVVFAAVVHPLMAVFAFSFCILTVGMQFLQKQEAAVLPALGMTTGALCMLPFGITLDVPSSPAYHAAAMLHGFHYIQLWHWYEQVGTVAPLGLFWWFGRIARARQWRELHLACRTLFFYDLAFLLAALLVDLPPRFESLARLQPLRSLHLLYIVMFLIMGGFVGEYLLKKQAWRWIVFFVPLALGMFIAQRALFPASAHIEWPGIASRNPWAQAFDWIRQNTPTDAVFALDPEYMHIAGEDESGFRCRSQRSRLADIGKDSGAVSMFPPLAEEWWTQVQAQTPWKGLGLADFARLKEKYGVSWVVVQQPGAAGLECAYQNNTVRVCKLP